VTQTCYRHPGRETAVSCSNCGRPICPDCMTATPVGMRCPECAGERTRVRSGAAAFSASGALYVTYTLLAINVLAFLAELAGGGASLIEGGGSVQRDLALFGPAVADQHEYYRIVTGGFMHAGLFHIAFNMYALYILGTLLEPSIGAARFLAIYVASLLTGALGVLAASPDAPTVGASGAIFGLFGAAFVIARGRRLEEVAAQLGFLLLINLAFTFSIPNISIGGHLGGLAGGALAGVLVVAGDRGMLGRNRIATELLAIAAIGAVGAVGSIVVA
jgi:membrane associated rhomboid family serine protease